MISPFLDTYPFASPQLFPSVPLPFASMRVLLHSLLILASPLYHPLHLSIKPPQDQGMPSH